MMSEWVRYSMWDRWRDLTRFRLSCEMALSSYRTYLKELPFTKTFDLVVKDPSKESGFKCSYDEFVTSLNDDTQLYRVLFPAYVGLVEDLARELIENLLINHNYQRTQFSNMPTTGDLTDAVRQFVISTQVEYWGDVILTSGSRSWSDVPDGKAGVVEAIVVRNLCAHGEPAFNNKAANRIIAANPGTTIKANDLIKLDKTSFKRHLTVLRGFARTMSDAVSNIGN